MLNGNNVFKIKTPPFTYNMYNKLWLHIPYPRIKSLMISYQKEYSDYITWIRNTKNRINVGAKPCIDNNLKSPCQQQHHIISYYMYINNKAILKN